MAVQLGLTELASMPPPVQPPYKRVNMVCRHSDVIVAVSDIIVAGEVTS